MTRIAIFFLLCSAFPAGATEPVVYEPAAAVADALSGPLTFVGRGGWFGMTRWDSCAYRNKKVVVVDIYCAKAWPGVFSAIIFSPTKGRLKLYLEVPEEAMALDWGSYKKSSWTIESEPHPAKAPPLPHDGTFAELKAYEEARYRLYAPACFTSRAGTPRCSKGLTAPGWTTAAAAFRAHPGDRWTALVKELRGLAQKNGVNR